MIKILVTGANGQLGSAFQRIGTSKDFKFFFFDKNTWDISKKVYPEISGFNYIINCAAYTAVDKAENEQELAFLYNTKAMEYLSEFANQNSAKLIHISSDYVYHNALNSPLKESDPCTPRGIYAQSKLDGETTVNKLCKKFLILRTSWVYGIEGHNFVKTMLKLVKNGNTIKVVSDQIGTPTFADDLAIQILNLINFDIQNVIQNNILNYSNEGVCSWYDFAHFIFKLSNLDIPLIPIQTSDYPTPAQRPPFSVLDKSKIKNLLGNHYHNAHWEDSLKAALSVLNKSL
ncbi:MAG: dTDP-4-dehydrorhamnose reductase [Saprospiraceae bacterium]|nr:dTDP-4-dehydrorhamnose reductase [Saprospiraceae bacterium]